MPDNERLKGEIENAGNLAHSACVEASRSSDAEEPEEQKARALTSIAHSLATLATLAVAVAEKAVADGLQKGGAG